MSELRTEVEEVILRRRSTRAYKKKKVPEHLIRRVLEAGRFAPSAGNCQPWRFIVFRNAELIKDMETRLIKIMSPLKKIVSLGEGIKRDVTVSLISLLGSQNVGDLRPLGAVKEVLSGNLKIYHDAPAVILILKDTRGIDSPDFDTGLCAQSMVLAAHSMGLGTCYIGFATLLRKDKQWMDKMKIKKPWAISTAITLGYPKYDSDGHCQRDLPQIDMYDEQGHLDITY